MNDSAQFQTTLRSAVTVPIAVMLALAIMLCWQIVQLMGSAAWVDHTDEVTSQAKTALRLIVDQETGQRGYLVTENPHFLEPFDKSLKELNPVFVRLDRLIADNPIQQQTLRQIREGYAQWLQEANAEMALAKKKPVRDEFNLERSKVLMDAERARFDAFLRREAELRMHRTRATQTLAQMTLISTAVITLLLGVMLAFLTRKRLAGLAQNYAMALQTERLAREQAEIAQREILAKSQEIAGLNADLEKRVLERTAELEASNRELEAFSYSVSHDLRAPLRSIDGFSVALLEDYGDSLEGLGKSYLDRIRANSQNMAGLIDGLLTLSRLTRSEMRRENVDLSAMAEGIINSLRLVDPERKVDVVIDSNIQAFGDVRLLRNVLENLLGNAWKFTTRTPEARIEFGVQDQAGQTVYFVRDNGAGFDMAYVEKLFGAFQRLHSTTEFEGTGIGLATVQRVVRRHGGQIWAKGAVGQGATFYFTLPAQET